MRLSVCIPTHNGRCRLLEEALESIASQAMHNLPMEAEIVVSDNASSDGTEEMVAGFASRHPKLQIVYGRNERDVRLENIERAVARARGDWCWLFGSDDLMADDGLKTVMEVIRRFPNASGVGVAKANFSHDMSAQLESDIPEFYPDHSELTHLTGFAETLGETAFLHAFMGTNIVRRDRFLDAADRKGREAIRRHPTWPHLIILADMLRHHPSWVWLPYVLIKARAGRPYLVEQDGTSPNLARMHSLLARSLRDAWAEIAGSDVRLFTTLIRKSYAVVGSPSVVRNLKAADGQTLGRDIELLASFTRAFWTLPEFRRTCFPLLLVPGALWRARSLRRQRRAQMPRLDPGEICTVVHSSAPSTATPRTSMVVRSILTNRGSRALQWANPFPVALGYRWFDAVSGIAVKSDDRTILPRPVASGESLELYSRVNVPWEPGIYDLRISPVQEHVVWFDDLDASYGASARIRVSPPF